MVDGLIGDISVGIFDYGPDSKVDAILDGISKVILFAILEGIGWYARQ